MGSKSDTWEYGLRDLLFQNDDFTGVGDAGGLRGSVGEGSLYLSLHTADPGDAGDQTTNEISYTGYARVAVPRNAAYWEMTAVSTRLDWDAVFPKMTGGAGGTVTHFGIGTSSSGAGKLLYHGAFSSGGDVSDGVIPQVDQYGIVCTED